MSEALIAAAVTVTAFVSTNLDNLLILAGLMSAARRRAEVVIGHGLVALAVIAVAWLLSGLGRILPVTAVGFLGLLPLAMGLRALLRPDAHMAVDQPRPGGGVGAVVAGLVPLCGDSLGVFVPLLAESPPRLALIVALTWCAMALLWAGLAAALLVLPGSRRALTRIAPRLMPFLLIAIGLYVLADTPTDLLVRGGNG
jgi:cadmium resistance protein CadD (predicted permease)